MLLLNNLLQLLLVLCLVHPTISANDNTAPTELCFTGTMDEVAVACEGHDCCTSITSCLWNDNTTVTVCPQSCQGDYACDFGDSSSAVTIRTASCIGDNACQRRSGTSPITIGPQSCHGVQVCQDAHASTVGRGSCYGYRACANIGDSVGDESCLQSWSCLPGSEAITEISKIVTRLLLAAMVVILIAFLHPKPSSSGALQQERMVLTMNGSS